MTIERYVAPRTLEEAAGILSQGGATILAGGTDLMPQVHSGKLIEVRQTAFAAFPDAELYGHISKAGLPKGYHPGRAPL